MVKCNDPSQQKTSPKPPLLPFLPPPCACARSRPRAYGNRSADSHGIDPSDMGLSEAEEIAELKDMFRSPPKKANKFKNRPAWDSTPLRNRPSALVGLKPVTREPWAVYAVATLRPISAPNTFQCGPSCSVLVSSHHVDACRCISLDPHTGMRTCTIVALRRETSAPVRNKPRPNPTRVAC